VSFSKLGRPNPRAGTPRLSRKPFVIVTTYIDESGTHNDAQHIILGGWVGRWGQWWSHGAPLVFVKTSRDCGI